MDIQIVHPKNPVLPGYDNQNICFLLIGDRKYPAINQQQIDMPLKFE